MGKDANWLLNVINVADGHVRTLVSSGGKAVGRAVWMPDGNSLIAPVEKLHWRRGQLQSIDYPKGELIALPTIFRITPRLSMSRVMEKPWPPFSAPVFSTSGPRRQRIHRKLANLPPESGPTI